MLISSMFGSPVVILPKSSSSCKPAVSGQIQLPQTGSGYRNGVGGIVIECSSRPKKKATAHHMKTRPKKSQPWDIRRKPTVYPPLPPLPPDWTLVSSSSAGSDGEPEPEAALPSTAA